VTSWEGSTVLGIELITYYAPVKYAKNLNLDARIRLLKSKGDLLIQF
jgi:hypothetical protein